MPTQTFIAFDADDTLWPNQPHFDHVEAQLLRILAVYAPYHANQIHEHVPAELLAGVEFRVVERLRDVLGLVG